MLIVLRSVYRVGEYLPTVIGEGFGAVGLESAQRLVVGHAADRGMALGRVGHLSLELITKRCRRFQQLDPHRVELVKQLVANRRRCQRTDALGAHRQRDRAGPSMRRYDEIAQGRVVGTVDQDAPLPSLVGDAFVELRVIGGDDHQAHVIQVRSVVASTGDLHPGHMIEFFDDLRSDQSHLRAAVDHRLGAAQSDLAASDDQHQPPIQSQHDRQISHGNILTVRSPDAQIPRRMSQMSNPRPARLPARTIEPLDNPIPWHHAWLDRPARPVTLSSMMSIKLDQLVAAMQRIAPLQYAEPWDNVGLLVEPARPRRIKRVLLTIDLTEPVMDEAIDGAMDAIIAYHPPIFDPLKRLTTGSARQRTIGRAMEKRIAIYSPHTALDAVPGGVCDWLCEGLGPIRQTRPIEPGQTSNSGLSRKLVVFVPVDHVDRLRAALAAVPGIGQIGNYSHCSFNIPGYGTFLGNENANPAIGRRSQLERADELRMEMVCSAGALSTAARVIAREHPYEEPAWEVYPLAETPMPDRGAGRMAELRRSVSLKTLVGRIKKHLGLAQVRVAEPCAARGMTTAYDTVAVCPGAGGSLFESIHEPVVLLTGEMRHHQVLSHTEAGGAVILTDHTHSERGYLERLSQRLADELPGAGGNPVDLVIARADRDPLRII